MNVRTILFLTFLSGTALANVQGGITLRVDQNTAQVDLGRDQVQEGDRVGIYQEVCQGPKVSLCSKQRVGSGVVSKILSDTRSEIRSETALNTGEGLVIQKE